MEKFILFLLEYFLKKKNIIYFYFWKYNVPTRWGKTFVKTLFLWRKKMMIEYKNGKTHFQLRGWIRWGYFKNKDEIKFILYLINGMKYERIIQFWYFSHFLLGINKFEIYSTNII